MGPSSRMAVSLAASMGPSRATPVKMSRCRSLSASGPLRAVSAGASAVVVRMRSGADDIRRGRNTDTLAHSDAR